MAKLRDPGGRVLEQVAEQLGAFMQPVHPLTFGAAGAPRWELQEHFPIIALDPANAWQAVLDKKDLAEICQETGYWHHQVSNANGPTGYAQSRVGGAATPNANATVTAYTATEDARDVSAALEDLDREMPSDNYEAQILDLRGYGLAAVVLVADQVPHEIAPSFAYVYRVVENDAGLEPAKLYASEDFLRALAKLGPIGGLNSDPGEGGPPIGGGPSIGPDDRTRQVEGSAQHEQIGSAMRREGSD